MSNKKKLLFAAGVGCIAVFGVEQILQKLGLMDSPETKTVNADFKNDIAWNVNAWNTLNRQNFVANVWNYEHFTKYIILQTMASKYTRVGIYSYITDFWANQLTNNPTDQQINDLVSYINSHIYCQMELSAILEDTQTYYPNFDISMFTNQTWYTKLLSASNTTLVPLFNAVHNLPNYFNVGTDTPTLQKQAQTILSSKTKVNY